MRLSDAIRLGAMLHPQHFEAKRRRDVPGQDGRASSSARSPYVGDQPASSAAPIAHVASTGPPRCVTMGA